MVTEEIHYYLSDAEQALDEIQPTLDALPDVPTPDQLHQVCRVMNQAYMFAFPCIREFDAVKDTKRTELLKSGIDKVVTLLRASPWQDPSFEPWLEQFELWQRVLPHVIAGNHEEIY